MIVNYTPKERNMLIALACRILILIAIILLSDKFAAYGFLGNTPDFDDYRYEHGAVLYSQEANSIIDVDAFTRIFDSMGDWTGHHLNVSNLLTEGCLWYWIVCILTYLTKWRWWIRILNILLSVFITKYVYELSNVLFSDQTANVASLVYAVFPYSVIFSCFSYKDTLVSFCIFYIVLFFVRAKNNVKQNKINLFKMIIVCIIFMLTRSGISEIWIGLCLFYYFYEEGKLVHVKNLFGMFLLVGLGTVAIVVFYDLIFHKFSSYILNASTVGLSGGAFVKITRIQDFWKIPFTILFSILQPIGFSSKIDTWWAIVCRCNIIMCPIAISAIINIVTRKRKDKGLSLILILIYTLSAVTSVLIFRQLYSVWPIPVMYGCDYLLNNTSDKYLFVVVLSVLLAIALIVVMG